MKTYAVKGVFQTIQGEGVNAGRAAVFVRLAGCNLWNGLESGRQGGRGGCARWCDTDFVRGRAMTAAGVVAAMEAAGPSRFAVVTGGEPMLQLDQELVTAMRGAGFSIAVETNGTIASDFPVDWLTVSPKAGTALAIVRADELKLAFPQVGAMPEDFASFDAGHRLLQPIDDAKRECNTAEAVAYCLAHPSWRLSLQTHKWIGVP